VSQRLRRLYIIHICAQSSETFRIDCHSFEVRAATTGSADSDRRDTHPPVGSRWTRSDQTTVHGNLDNLESLLFLLHRSIYCQQGALD
jgi:hypothetical protein